MAKKVNTIRSAIEINGKIVIPENTIQGKFMKEYYNHNFSIQKACDAVNIKRATFYYWLSNDITFTKAFNDLKSLTFSFINTAFMEGLLCEDLVIRAKYLSLVPKRMIHELYGVTDDTTDSATVDINNITLG